MPEKKKKVYLYRIMDFCRVVQIFESKALYFAHPSTWDDPFETRVKHQSSHAMFAQCWSRIAASDAIWRIYSPNHMGVRISTTENQIKAAIKESLNELGYSMTGRSVVYLRQSDLDVQVTDIARNLDREFNINQATEILYLKREAFSHEAEWRLTIYCHDFDNKEAKDGVLIKIDPYSLINRILFDPRAPDELVNAFTHYFKDVLKFKGKIGRSVLYKSPKRISLVDSN